MANEDSDKDPVMLMAYTCDKQNEPDICDYNDSIMLMVTTCEGGTSEEEWYLDTGCSNHMTGHKECLVNLDLSKKTKISLDDEKSIKCRRHGNCCNSYEGW